MRAFLGETLGGPSTWADVEQDDSGGVALRGSRGLGVASGPSNKLRHFWTIEKCLSISLKSEGALRPQPFQRCPYTILLPAVGGCRPRGKLSWKESLRRDSSLPVLHLHIEIGVPEVRTYSFDPPALPSATSTPVCLWARGPEGLDTWTLFQDRDAESERKDDQEETESAKDVRRCFFSPTGGSDDSAWRCHKRSLIAHHWFHSGLLWRMLTAAW